MGALDFLADNPGAKAALWAHNSHVSGGGPEGYPWAGTVLRSRMEGQYRVVGSFSREGVLMAKDAKSMAAFSAADGTFKPGMPRIVPGHIPFRVPLGFVEDILCREVERGVVFVADLLRDPLCAEFLKSRRMECCGAGDTFDPEWSAEDRIPFSVAD